MGEGAAETARALSPKALRFSPKSNRPVSSFHSGKTALYKPEGGNEVLGQPSGLTH